MSFGQKLLGLALLMANLLVLGVCYLLPYRMSKRVAMPQEAEALPGHAALFFGFTACPSVCPVTLARLAEAQDLLPDANMQVVFVNLTDQEPTEVDAYAKAFHPRFVGWQLGLEARQGLAQACAAFVSPGKDGPQHSPNVYLMRRVQEGWELQAVYHQYPADPSALAALISETLSDKLAVVPIPQFLPQGHY
jgi:cytochrome oxidase Cu insertion factor (SCO1/SenC/PrrC family)